MKITKYLAIALAMVVILASISWVLRNSIIQRISGPILSEYGMAVTDVSLDALATETATIAYLEVEHQNGTTIAIDDLTLPIGTSTSGTRTFAAEKATIDIPSEDETEPLALAELIDQFLSLLDALPDTEVVVNEVNVSSYPTVQDVRWSWTEEQQKLTANLDAVYLTAQIIAKDEESFEAKFSLKQTSLKAPEQSITTDIRLTDNGIRLSGATMLGLPTMGMIARSIAASFGAALAGVEFASGTALFEISAELPFDTNQPASVVAYLRPAAPFEFAFSVQSGVVNVVSVRSASPIKLEVTDPETHWSISEEQVSLSMSYDKWNDISTTVTNLNCVNGLSCFMNMEVAMNNADLIFAKARRLELSATQDIEFGDDRVKALVRPDAELSLLGISIPDTDLARLDARLMSTATLEVADSGWQLAAETLDAEIESLSLQDDISISASVSLRNMLASDSNQALSVNTAIDSASSQLTWGELVIAIPGFSGDVALHDSDVMADLITVGFYQDTRLQAQHNLGSDDGHLSIIDAALSFDAQRLSDRISPWSNDWDIGAGTVSFDLQFNWEQTDSGWQLDGQSSVEIMNLAGFYGDSAFAGLSTSLNSTYESATGFTVEPANIDVALVEIGLPIENITADYTLNPGALSVDVQNLQMRAFGGIVTAEPFSYELDSDRNSLLLRAASIELTELLTLKEFEAIELSGSVGAELPVIIEGDAVSIMGGTLTGEAPGGVIRYRPDIIPDDTGTPGIGIVTRALSNFEYETLTSTVAYSKDGDLVLQMQLAGRNPDLEDNRPVVLNLGVENNIPDMLRSLQAARAVEEILEKRIEK